MNILIIGQGYQGEKIYQLIKKMYDKFILTITGRHYIEYDLNQYDKIIIATPPETHLEVLNYCLLNSKADIYVEKPLSLNTEFTIPSVDTKRVMVGNKFLYSPSLQLLKKELENKEIKGIFGKWIKSKDCNNYGIFFDILYHHLHILLNLSKNKTLSITERIEFSKDEFVKSGIIIGYIDSFVPFILEGSCKNLYGFFENSIRIETDNETYRIYEENERLIVSMENMGYLDSKSTLYESIKYFLENKEFRTIGDDLYIINELRNS